jgi:hypothetical protein
MLPPSLPPMCAMTLPPLVRFGHLRRYLPHSLPPSVATDEHVNASLDSYLPATACCLLPVLPAATCWAYWAYWAATYWA